MASQQKVQVMVPRGYSENTLQRIGQSIIDFIITRTLSGLDKDGNPFPTYTNRYEDVKGSSDVDLSLSGEMLNMLEVLAVKDGVITIGYPSGDEINGKVEGNRIGSYGGSPNSRKARDFLGISDGDLKTLLEEYPMSSPELLRGRFEDQLDRISNALTDTQVERIRQQLLEEDLDLRDL